MTARERMVRVVAEALDRRGNGLAFTDAIAVVEALEAEMGLQVQRAPLDTSGSTPRPRYDGNHDTEGERMVTDWIAIARFLPNPYRRRG